MDEAQSGDANRLPLWQYGERRLQHMFGWWLCAWPVHKRGQAPAVPDTLQAHTAARACCAGYNTSSELYIFIRTLAWYRRQLDLPSLPLQRERSMRGCMAGAAEPSPSAACARQMRTCPLPLPSKLPSGTTEAYVDNDTYAFTRGPDMLVMLTSGAVDPLPAAYSLANLTAAAGKELCDALSRVRRVAVLCVR